MTIEYVDGSCITCKTLTKWKLIKQKPNVFTYECVSCKTIINVRDYWGNTPEYDARNPLP